MGEGVFHGPASIAISSASSHTCILVDWIACKCGRMWIRPPSDHLKVAPSDPLKRVVTHTLRHAHIVQAISDICVLAGWNTHAGVGECGHGPPLCGDSTPAGRTPMGTRRHVDVWIPGKGLRAPTTGSAQLRCRGCECGCERACVRALGSPVHPPPVSPPACAFLAATWWSCLCKLCLPLGGVFGVIWS